MRNNPIKWIVNVWWWLLDKWCTLIFGPETTQEELLQMIGGPVMPLKLAILFEIPTEVLERAQLHREAPSYNRQLQVDLYYDKAGFGIDRCVMNQYWLPAMAFITSTEMKLGTPIAIGDSSAVFDMSNLEDKQAVRLKDQIIELMDAYHRSGLDSARIRAVLAQLADPRNDLGLLIAQRMVRDKTGATKDGGATAGAGT